jgi:hypothetical protein
MSDRSKRVETNVNVFRLRLAAVADGSVVFGWDYPGSTLLRVRILRAVAPDAAATPGAAATSGSAGAPPPAAAPGDGATTPTPEPGPTGQWRVIYDGDTGSFRDRDVSAGSSWRYAVFARDGSAPWVLWRDEVVTLP